MKRIYGSMPTTIPEGFAKRVHFPVLAVMDKVTGDHRRLDSAGGRSREGMPHQIRTMPASTYGHDGAVPSGALFQIEIDTDTGLASGDGFIIDNPMGLLTLQYIATKVQHKNSVDLSEIKARFVDDMETDEYYIDFYEWAIGATTFVGTPAFAEAYGEIVACLAGADDTELMASLRQDELIASLLADPMESVVCEFSETTLRWKGDQPLDVELTADGLPRVPHEAFLIPESPVPHKIKTDGKRVWGHLGKWNTCHDGLPQCVMIPRPKDGYASFNKPGAFTTKGQIQTGPIFALGGHRTLLGKITPAEEAAAYGGIENSWCDVRVTEGVHGPWISGYIRPGVDPNIAYAAVASRISGHWKGDKLKAIVSVNAEGFDVEGDGELAASYFAIDDDGEIELIASFCGDDAPETATQISGAAMDEIVAAVVAKMAEAPAGEATPAPAAPDQRQVQQAMLAILLED